MKKVFFIFLLFVCIVGCKKQCPDPAILTIVEQGNKQLIDSLTREAAYKSAQMNQLRQRIDEGMQRERILTEKYKTVYEKVYRTTDADKQLLLTQELLAAHARHPLERD